jgi:catechol 2,3-dioxygenase-like lactoylglutathione lyase family enzyme
LNHRPAMTLTGIVLDTPDPQELGAFYRRLLGWETGSDESEWVTLHPPKGGAGLSFQREGHYVRPVWPAAPGQPQMMAHLDVEVQDLEQAAAWAEATGATLADHQPQIDVRVFLDPHGHPFCLSTADPASPG